MRYRPERRVTASTPWFRAHPSEATVVACTLFVAVVILQELDSRASDATALLYVLPIALMAVTFGLVGGLASAAAGYIVLAVFAVTNSNGHIDVEGWISRAAAMFLLGALLGRASDQTCRADELALENQRERLLLEEKNRRYAEGLELSDSVLQNVAVAKWLVEQGNDVEAAGLLSDALDRGQHMVGELLPVGRLASASSSSHRCAGKSGRHSPEGEPCPPTQSAHRSAPVSNTGCASPAPR